MFSSKIMTILTLLAVACFAALITLQVLEWMYFDAPRSVWPVGAL